MDNEKLTEEDLQKLQEYLTKAEELKAREPGLAFRSEEWEGWNHEFWHLNREYNRIIVKVLLAYLARNQNGLDVMPAAVLDLAKIFFPQTIDEAAEEAGATPSEPPEDKCRTVQKLAAALHTKVAPSRHFGLMHDKVNDHISFLPGKSRGIEGCTVLDWSVNQAPKGRPEVDVGITLIFENDDNVNISRRITGYDNVVFHAIGNLIFRAILAGRRPPFNFSPKDIWREMTGTTDTRKAFSENQKKAIIQSVDKMRYTHLFMDLTQEINSGYLKTEDDRVRCIKDKESGKDSWYVDDYYIPARSCPIRGENGKIVQGYMFYDLPFLYSYNIDKGHIVIVPEEVVSMPSNLESEEHVLVFRNYLLREIGLMYKHKRDSRKILYSSIYKNTDTPSPEERTDKEKCKSEESYKAAVRNIRKVDRDHVNCFLDSWRQKSWILDYKQTKQGRTYDGVEVVLNPANFTDKQIERKD